VKVFVTGATGFIGRPLVAALVADGHQVVGLARGGADLGGAERVAGDVREAGPWQERAAACDAVVHLAGASIGGRRWSAAWKDEIRRSRVEGTARVVDAKPRVLLCAGGADYYAFDEGDRPYAEDAPCGDSFLAEVCAAWEAAAHAAEANESRVACLRTGVVLGRGGALARMTTPFKLFFGGPVGSGRQWFSWVHLDDVVGAYRFALAHEAVRGPINLVGPEAVRQKDFARALGKALRRPSWAPVPGPVLRLAVGELADYLLHGRRVVPAVLERLGYAFHHATLGSALASSL
jgi:uncharacterized protein